MPYFAFCRSALPRSHRAVPFNHAHDLVTDLLCLACAVVFSSSPRLHPGLATPCRTFALEMPNLAEPEPSRRCHANLALLCPRRAVGPS